MVKLSLSPEERALEEAVRRRDLVNDLARLRRESGCSQNAACAAMGVSAATLSRYTRAYETGGLEGLMPKFTQSGRKPLARLTPEQERIVRQLVLKSDPNAGRRISVSFALRIFAHSDACPDDLREVILKPRRSKHSITPTLKRQARIRPEDKMLYRGEKHFKLNGYSQPRDLTYVDETGAVVPIAPGVCFEGDDMHVNEPFWVEWNDPADPCAARYGVRAFRAQLIPWLDVGSGAFRAFSLVLRYTDAYRAKDLRWSLNHFFQSVGIPKILRMEMGAWKAHDVESIATDARVCRITHATSPGSKFIENRFHNLQKALALHGVPVGRKRGEFEAGGKLWTATRQGRKDPRTCFMSLEAVMEKIESCLAFINADPMEGSIYGAPRARELYALDRWCPDEIWEAGLKAPLRRPTLEESWRLQPEIRQVSLQAGMARVRCDEVGAVYWFHSPRFGELGSGWKVQVAFDPADPGKGAAIINAEPRDGCRNRAGIHPGEILCLAEHVDRVPQFNLSEEAGDSISFERRNRYSRLCRLLYREILPYGRRGGAQYQQAKDGRGNVAELTMGRTAQSDCGASAAQTDRPPGRGGGAAGGRRDDRRKVTPTEDPLLKYL